MYKVILQFCVVSTFGTFKYMLLPMLLYFYLTKSFESRAFTSEYFYAVVLAVMLLYIISKICEYFFHQCSVVLFSDWTISSQGSVLLHVKGQQSPP